MGRAGQTQPALLRQFITQRTVSKHEDAGTLIEQIIRAKTALHPQLVAHLKDGKLDIGGGLIDDLIAEVDAGLSRSEWMLVLFKNETAAVIMAESLRDAE